MSKCVAECCSVSQGVLVCCSNLKCVSESLACLLWVVYCSELQCVAVCCRVLHCVAVCRSVLQCVAGI